MLFKQGLDGSEDLGLGDEGIQSEIMVDIVLDERYHLRP